MTEAAPRDAEMQGRTTRWRHKVAIPFRAFLRTESSSAGVLVAAIVIALIWANIDISSYERVWHTFFSIRLGHYGVTRDLRTWVNSGLMTLFFLVVGLEARREFDLGDLRDRSRFVLPAAAGLVGMLDPGADLPGDQSRWPGRARLGRRDVHRHRARAGSPDADRPQGA